MNELLNIREIHNLELEMLLEMDRICKTHNLNYYLAYGTLLGAVRHKGFIPWDTDIDIIVDIDSYQRFCDILQRELSTKYCLSSTKTNKNYDSLKARIHLKNYDHRIIYIDIFPMVGVPRGKLCQRIFSKIAYINYRCYFIKKVKPNINYKYNIMKRIIVNILKKSSPN